ncbi:MAG: GNAT family N-acetyltransferase [Nocardioides sp.]|nr:GNAT family N-acetyltransferase [Nocardioides sp.]
MSERTVRVSGGDLVLREFGPEDETDLLAAFTDPEIARWNPQATDAASVSVWASARNDWTIGEHTSWAVGDAGGRLVGSVSLHKIDLEQGDAELGYWVAPWARRRGVAVRAATAATAYGFNALGLHRVHLFHATENRASCAVAGLAGFLLEGRLRQSYRYADGVHHDEHLHARLVTD